MAPSLPEPIELEQDESPAHPAASAPSSASAASRKRGSLVSIDEMTVRRTATRFWPALTALGVGCVVATLILAAALQSEFPLFSEASAARGRDCTKIASARHALDAALGAHLPLRSRDADAARAIRSAVAAFDARTQDLATPAVQSALGPIRGGLHTLSDSVQAYAAAPSASLADDAVEEANSQVTQAWRGAIARVCS
ncbi:transporter [Leifsonia sp. 2MCAF36]|uniref:transporter n=1 Tax=Leifsonia sp. 2MCAF36 TaxID=3232988 RepID=UPI003F948B0A